MSIQFKRVTGIIIVALLVLCGISISHHNDNNWQLAKTKAVGAKLARNTKYKRKYVHRPILTKNVPSSYRKMMEDGKNVASAVQTIMKQTNGGRKKPNKSLASYKRAISILNLNVDKKSANWQTHSAWSPFANDQVKVMPGEASSNGQFDCAFLIYNQSKRIDGIFLAEYDPNTRDFVSISNYGTRQFQKQTVNPQLKKKLRLKLIRKNRRQPRKRPVKGDATHVK